MKSLFLLLICISLFCACQISQNAQTDGLSNTTNLNQQTTVNSVEIKNAEIEKPQPVDDSRFSSVKIDRTDQKDKFSLRKDIEYPKLKNPKTPPENKFNRFVKKQVDEQIADFNNFLAEKQKEIKVKGKQEYYINLNYTVDYYSDNFTSVVMNWRGYSGYLNLDYFPSTINFDLKKGRAIELKEIFEQNSKYLEKLSELAIKKLNRTCLSCPCKDGTSAGKPLPEGVTNVESPGGMFDLNKAVSPKIENFNNWSITTEGLRITFNEYQVGPGCIGIINIVIPFSDLQPILRDDLNFN